jgi:hypothetical protein
MEFHGLLTRAPNAFGMRGADLVRLGGLGVLAALYFAWAICDRLTDLGGDSATYMLMARAWSPFVAANPIFTQAANGAIYPPLFPILIGLLGGGFAAAHALVAGSLLVAITIYYLWLRETGLGAGLSTAAVLLFAALPGTYLIALNIWSENTYLCWSLLALLAASRVQCDSTRRQAWWWAATAATVAALLTRSAGVPLLLTFTIFTVVRRQLNWRAMLLVAWVPYLLWSIWTRLHGSGMSFIVRELQNSYGVDPWSHLATQISSETQVLIVAWFGLWFGAPASWPLLAVVAAFGLLCVVGLTVRLGQGHFDAVYCALYLALLLVWPWPSEASRLLYVVIPILLGHGMWLLDRLSRRLRPRLQLAAHGVLAGLLTLAVLPSLAVCLQRRLQDVPIDAAAIKHSAGYYSDFATDRQVAIATMQLVDDIPSLARRVPPSDCVFAIKPSAIMLLAERMSLGPPPPGSDDIGFDRLLHQCRYAYLVKGQSATIPYAFYPRERLHGYRVLSVLSDKIDPQGGEIAELVELTPFDRNIE